MKYVAVWIVLVVSLALFVASDLGADSVVLKVTNQSEFDVAIYAIAPNMSYRLGAISAHTYDQFAVPDNLTTGVFYFRFVQRGGAWRANSSILRRTALKSEYSVEIRSVQLDTASTPIVGKVAYGRAE